MSINSLNKTRASINCLHWFWLAFNRLDNMLFHWNWFSWIRSKYPDKKWWGKKRAWRFEWRIWKRLLTCFPWPYDNESNHSNRQKTSEQQKCKPIKYQLKFNFRTQYVFAINTRIAHQSLQTQCDIIQYWKWSGRYVTLNNFIKFAWTHVNCSVEAFSFHLLDSNWVSFAWWIFYHLIETHVAFFPFCKIHLDYLKLKAKITRWQLFITAQPWRCLLENLLNNMPALF